MVSNEGRTIIRLQGALSELQFKDDNEREAYLGYLADTLPKKIEQNLKTWRCNRKPNPQGT